MPGDRADAAAGCSSRWRTIPTDFLPSARNFKLNNARTGANRLPFKFKGGRVPFG